jgi:hypothetical protein
MTKLFTPPKQTETNSLMEYTPDKITPKSKQQKITGLFKKIPTKHKSSPTKLAVPGKAVLETKKKKKKKENKGIT